ncbi:site-specific integrase [Rhizobium leguminosarum]|uniref:site-specific integrase n=1 Tax=Rhizobium leguminosarum TaxID=384 RepID=UPI001FE0D2EC|nr:site-specific integrase [Rhizobium leguminosarum]
MAGLSYMQRRTSGIYEFRKRLPQDLAGKPAPKNAPAALSELINPDTGRFKRELTVSLKTTNFADAKRKDMREALRVIDLFALAVRYQRGEVGEEVVSLLRLPSVEEIEADTIAALLKEDETEREQGDARRYMQTPEERAQWPDLMDPGFGRLGMAEGHLEAKQEWTETLSKEYRSAFASRNPDIVRAELNAYLKASNFPIDPSSPYYREAGLAVLRGHVKAYDLMLKRQEGEDIPTPSPSPAKGPTLSEAFKAWREGTPARGGKKASPSTVREAERAVRYFTEWHGDLRLGDITKEKARDFRTNGLARIPTRLTGKLRSMSLRTLVKAGDGGQELIHAASVNKYLNLLAAIVSACEREGLMDSLPVFSNPFTKLSLTIDKRNDPNRREPFSEADLKALFGSGVYARGERPLGGGGEAAYWLPLIALFSGARLNEIAQLRIRDLRQDAETGLWFIDIGTEGDRSIKTASSRRQVPLHPELIRLGLLRYRQNQLDNDRKDTARLWPDIKSADEAYRSTAWSKWFNRYLRTSVGIKDPSIVFHSLRHTFKRMARDAGLSEELHDALTGHAGGGGVGRSYGSGFGLRALGEAMARIEVPSPVKALPEWEPRR